MKKILSLSVAAVLCSNLVFAQIPHLRLPYPQTPTRTVVANKVALNAPHVPLRLPTVQPPASSKTVTIRESQNPAKVTKSVAKRSKASEYAKHSKSAYSAKAKATTQKTVSAVSPVKEAQESAVASENKENIMAAPTRQTAKKYSRRIVPTPPRQVAATASATSVQQSQSIEDQILAANLASETYSLDANGSRIAPPSAQKEVVAVQDEMPSARPKMQPAKAPKEVEPLFYGAHYKFDTETISYGTVAKGSDGKRKFYFRNDGSEPLTISSIIPGCSCVTAELPKEPIAPGKTGFIEVEYDTNIEGAFIKDFVVSSNAGGDDAVKIVYIKGTVR